MTHKHDTRLSGDELIAHVLADHPNAVTARDHDDEHAGPNCPECESAVMTEDDHVWVCPGCGYETSEPYD